ncbi:MAG TPA: type VI secretion system tip protein TssI/VgrG [Terracidiphilus sp.]|jgi:type VI secretion system secreted protein VgrG|nr:type VI secretion system tip protein TssI/VgrG [Terracidiphilus sp.]
MPYTQEGRLISIDTGLSDLGYPDESLLLTGFSGHEAMSRLFKFQLDLLQEKAVEGFQAVKFQDIVGKNVTINVTLSDGTQRYFNGLVSRFAVSGEDSIFVQYEMEVVPWTWLLTRYADCKIFHNKTVNAIIEEVFSDRSQTDFKFQLNNTYPTLEYCVQYRETDFNFISRLMEQYGIFYYFEHESDKHTMVIADSSNSLSSCPGQETAGFNLAGGGLDEDDVVNTISFEQVLLSGKYTLNDYYFETPAANLLISETTVWGDSSILSFELYDYPGDYTNRTDGTAAAKLRMQEVEAGFGALQGSSVCRAFTTGYNFDLTDAPQPGMNTTYLLTEIQHTATAAGGYSSSGGGEQGGGDSYSNHFTCIPGNLTFRPARLTPKPFVQGPQTAVVVGKSQDQNSGDADSGSDGEEIWVDKYGRVVVLFPWDRAGACSCWVRVSQDWAGQGWGSMTIPRVGQEVIVSFIEGDPDRPIVTGRVYNATQVVPYKLPDYQTRSTFMTRSSKGGSASTYNELRFEDKTGAEQVFIRAQYDYDTQVLHDTREAIGNNRSLTVAKDQMETVGGDLHTQVTGGVIETVGKDVNTNITGGVVEQVGKDVNTTVTGGVIESVGKDVNTTVSGGLIESVGKDANTSVSQNLNVKTGQAINMNAGTNLVSASATAYSHNAGTSIDLKGGTTVTIEAGVTLTLVSGGNSIVIGPSGVSITGTMVMINSGGGGGSANAPSPTSPTSPASPTSPGSPTDPDKADDGKTGTKLGGGDFASSPGAAAAGGSAAAAGAQGTLLEPGSPAPANVISGAEGAAAGAAGAASSAANQAEQAAQQATQAAAQGAQQAANAAQAAATQAQQAAQQAEQQAQQAVQQVEQQAQQTAAQAQQAAQQAQQAANQAVGQAKAAAQQAAAQAEQQAQQAQAAAQQAEQQAQAAAAQVQQQAQAAAAQAQQAAQQAQQAAQQAQQQAQQAAQQAQQQAQQAVQQGQQAAQQAAQQAQQAAQQAKQAAQQAQQQAQQAAQQAQAAAAQAQQQAQQAAGQVTQAASGAQQQASQAAAGAQQAASQAMGQVPKGL